MGARNLPVSDMRMLQAYLRVFSSGMENKTGQSAFKIKVLSVTLLSFSSILHLLGSQKRVFEK